MSLTEQRLAFHGPVRLQSWSETSKQGFRFKLELVEGRDALSHFDKATRRRGKRAGQRYVPTWQTADGRCLDEAPTELWFIGANWSHQGSAVVTFELGDPDDVAIVKSWVSSDSESSAPAELFLGLVQIDDDERPVNQQKADLVEWAEGLQGGPISKNAAMLCRDPDFQRFVGLRLNLAGGPATAEQCDSWIKRMCGIHTKRLLDYEHPETGVPFSERYQGWVKNPFVRWREAGG